MVKHRFKPVEVYVYDPVREIPRGHATKVYECKGCGERIVLPPPSGFTKKAYLRRIGITRDCDLQKVKQVMEW